MARHFANAPAAIFTDIGRVPARLCSVVDNGDKGIRVYLQKITNLEDVSQELPVGQEHISAYPNEVSGTVHIHLTHGLKHAEISDIDRSLVANRNDGDFAAAVLARTVNDRDNRAAEPKKSKYGSIVSIAPYDVGSSTLVTCMCFALNAAAFPDLTHLGLSLVVIEGKKISSGMYYTYLDIFSYVRGVSYSLATSMPRINKGKKMQLGGGVPLIRPAAGLQAEVEMLMQQAVDGYLRLLKSECHRLGQDIDITFPNVINTSEPVSILVARGRLQFGTLLGPVHVQLQSQ